MCTRYKGRAALFSIGIAVLILIVLVLFASREVHRQQLNQALITAIGRLTCIKEGPESIEGQQD